jgi:hypothetical protein
VVQDTGPSSYLDGGRGILRFSSLEQAAEALEGVCSDYPAHAVAARELAVTHFDATEIVGEILESTLS